MKYKLGDFVRFVDEKMEGFITRIMDDEMIGVTVEDDFEIPVLASKVTMVHGYKPPGSVINTITEETPVNKGEFKNKGVYIGLVNDAKANSVVHFYLINDTSFQILATLTTEKQVFKGEYAGIISPNSSVKIYSAQLADLQLWPKFTFNILFYTTQNIEPPAPLTLNEKFKAKDFSGSKKQLPVLNQPGWLIQLDEPDFVIDALQLKESFYKTTEEKTKVEKPAREIDLHIEKLRNDHQFLDSVEILKIQLDYFNKALDSAIVHQLHDIVFIHGAGNGVLRHEIQKILSKHPKCKLLWTRLKRSLGMEQRGWC